MHDYHPIKMVFAVLDTGKRIVERIKSTLLI